MFLIWTDCGTSSSLLARSRQGRALFVTARVFPTQTSIFPVAQPRAGPDHQFALEMAGTGAVMCADVVISY